jgi:HAD superfamily hydrolase (TIGR01490 family)
MNVAAFFDLDGTLLPPPSLERRFLRFLFWRGELGAENLARWLTCFLLRAPFDLRNATDGNKAHLIGVRVTLVGEWAAWLDRYPVQVFPEALQRLAWHAARGHRIFLVSGTLEPLARVFVARCLPISVAVCATQLEALDGRWTGRVLGNAISGFAKARTIERLATDQQLDLECSFAYGDRFADRWMLARVGNPVVVNPSLLFRVLARRRGWPVVDWRIDLPGRRPFPTADTEAAPQPPTACDARRP